VLIDITSDAFNEVCEYTERKTEAAVAHYGYARAGDCRYDKRLKQAGDTGGRGVVLSNAADKLFEFAEKIDAPVACTLMGTSSFRRQQLFTGMVGIARH
jgi:acetolactate synthase-1/2/3 large subunit